MKTPNFCSELPRNPKHADLPRQSKSVFGYIGMISPKLVVGFTTVIPRKTNRITQTKLPSYPQN